MRPTFIALLAALAVLPSQAAPDVAGRWSGRAQIPGADLPLIVDLAKDPAGAWIGSMIIPGFNVKGAPLANVTVSDDKVSFDAGDALGAAPNSPATFSARIDNDGVMAGELRQAGNVAPFNLKRAGEAQVERAARSTAVARETEGRWVGEFQLGGYPRHVTVDIANRAGSPAAIDFVVVGKATTKLPIDLVREEEGLLRIESRAYGTIFEGRVRKDENRIDGVLEIGSVEQPLILRRAGARS